MTSWCGDSSDRLSPCARPPAPAPPAEDGSPAALLERACALIASACEALRQGRDSEDTAGAAAPGGAAGASAGGSETAQEHLARLEALYAEAIDAARALSGASGRIGAEHADT